MKEEIKYLNQYHKDSSQRAQNNIDKMKPMTLEEAQKQQERNSKDKTPEIKKPMNNSSTQSLQTEMQPNENLTDNSKSGEILSREEKILIWQEMKRRHLQSKIKSPN